MGLATFGSPAPGGVLRLKAAACTQVGSPWGTICPISLKLNGEAWCNWQDMPHITSQTKSNHCNELKQLVAPNFLKLIPSSLLGLRMLVTSSECPRAPPGPSCRHPLMLHQASICDWPYLELYFDSGDQRPTNRRVSRCTTTSWCSMGHGRPCLGRSEVGSL